MASNEAPDATGTHLQQEAGRMIRPIAIGAGPAAAPLAAAALHPVLGAALLATEVVFVLVVFGVVVFGTQDQVDRVFRLLRWLRGRPEPPAPKPSHQNNQARISADQSLEIEQARNRQAVGQFTDKAFGYVISSANLITQIWLICASPANEISSTRLHALISR